MTRIEFTAMMLGIALAGSAAIALPISGAYAQADQPPPPPADHYEGPGDHHRPMMEHFSPGRHVEGRIAFLKTELKITDAQLPLWSKVADVMRANAKAMDDEMATLKGKEDDEHHSALDHLEMRAKFEHLHAEASERFVAAFKPLYTSLSDDQKKNADELFERHFHRH